MLQHDRPQGTASAEVQAARAAGEAARGGTAYVNLETGDCHGDTAATAALLTAGVSRVVIGLPHPLGHLRGAAIGSLRANGVEVDVLGVSQAAADPAHEQAALEACLTVNEVSNFQPLMLCIGCHLPLEERTISTLAPRAICLKRVSVAARPLRSYVGGARK